MKRIKESQEKQKRNYDKKYRSQTFYVGDTVLLKKFRARGLDEKYFGPYQIIDVRENTCRCEIESLVNRKTRVVHWNNLKRL